MTPLDLLTEMQSFITVEPKLLAKAQSSEITDNNNSTFRTLVKDWTNGLYDEDPEMVVQAIRQLI